MGNIFGSRTEPKSSYDNSTHQNEDDIWPYVWALQDPTCLDWKQGMSAEEIQECAVRQTKLPVSITETLYLSDHKNACNMDKLKTLGITHVLNVAGPAARGPVDKYKSHNIEYKEIDADDEEGYDMLGLHLQQCRAFIQSAATEGGKVIVHCVAGINRSGVIAAAEYMLSSDPSTTTVLTTVAHCRRQRGNCFLWNNSFQLQLVRLARQHHLLGPSPGEPGCYVTQRAPLSHVAGIVFEGSGISDSNTRNNKMEKKKSIKDLF